MQVRIMRILRMKYHITMAEIADACGISGPRISEIELKIDSEVTPNTAARIADAFTNVAEKKRGELQLLCEDLKLYRNSLMECVEESEYEL